jgi:hypothetical protein
MRKTCNGRRGGFRANLLRLVPAVTRQPARHFGKSRGCHMQQPRVSRSIQCQVRIG